MTVQELREALSAFPDDWSVVTGWYGSEHITSVDAGVLTSWDICGHEDTRYPTVVLDAYEL